MFKTDGSVHHGGIANELETIDTLNRLGIYSETVEHRGGTRQKADAAAGDRCISIKRKQGIATGSFDWCNTTKVPSAISAKFDGFRAIVAELRKLTEAERADEVDALRDTFNRASSNAFDTLETAELVSFLRDTFAKQAGYDLVITDTKAGKLHHFAAEARPVLSLLADGWLPTFAEATKAGQTSRAIIFRKGAEAIPSGLRLRVTSNNGISAFLGLGGKANKSSSLVIKLQQDSIPALLESAEATTYTV